MVNVILFQKNKKNEEILYDNFNHKARSIKPFEKIGSFKSISRKREIKIKRCLIGFSMIKIVYSLFMTITEISCTNMVELPASEIYKNLTIIVSGFNLVAKLIIFCILMVLLNFY